MITEPYSLAALGTTWWIEIFDDIDDDERRAAFGSAALIISDFETKYSRFRPDSLISRLNETKEISAPSPELVTLLTYGQALYSRSNEIFNILIGESMVARGYDNAYSLTPQAELASVFTPNPNTALIITPTLITLLAGSIDIGGFGKGYVIDLVAKEFISRGIQYFLINGGGDIYTTSNHCEPITIYLEHPTQPRLSIGETTLVDQGFAASSPYKRQWHHKQQSLSHLMLDNNTIPTIATFTKALTARDADAFATTFTLTDQTTIHNLSLREKIQTANYLPAKNELWVPHEF